MLLSPLFQQRIKHFDLLLAKELSLIEREHIQNLIIHQKLENSIRRSNQFTTTTTHRNYMPVQFDHIYNERKRSLDYHNISTCDQHRLHPETESTNSLEDVSRESLLERRRKSAKTCQLPPIIKANLNERLKRENKYRHCIPNLPPVSTKLETDQETLMVVKAEPKTINEYDPSPIQKQVRSFLDTLPTYKGTQKGFDSFAATSLYSYRKPINIR